MKTLISKEVIEKVINLSAEWNNTGYIIVNESGIPYPTVWNQMKYMTSEPEIIAYVNGNDGFVLENDDYELEIDPKELIN